MNFYSLFYHEYKSLHQIKLHWHFFAQLLMKFNKY